MIDEATLVRNSHENDYDYVPVFEREARVSISLHSTIFVSNSNRNSWLCSDISEWYGDIRSILGMWLNFSHFALEHHVRAGAFLLTPLLLSFLALITLKTWIYHTSYSHFISNLYLWYFWTDSLGNSCQLLHLLMIVKCYRSKRTKKTYVTRNTRILRLTKFVIVIRCMM